MAVSNQQDGVLSPLIGHRGAKAIIRSALRRGDVDLHLSGPPASGKSVVLLAVEEHVPGAEYVEARGLSERKLRDILKDDPPMLLIDEFDNMSNDAYKALNTAMEQGRVTKNVHGDAYDVEIDTQVFAASNDIDQIPDDVADRFVPVSFEPYSRSEFTEVCSQLLPTQVDWVGEADNPEQVAARVAEVVWDETDTRSPRKARDAARLASSAERVAPIVQAMNDPKADVDSEPVRPEDLPHGSRESRQQADSEPRGATGSTMPSDPKAALPEPARRSLEQKAAERGIELSEEDYAEAYRAWQRRVK